MATEGTSTTKKTVKAPVKKKVAKATTKKAAAPKKKRVAKEVVQQDRGARRVREGVVISDKMNKTIVVEITRTTRHPVYEKIIKLKSKATVHDEKSEAKTGDKVRIQESRPISKRKRWRLVEVVS